MSAREEYRAAEVRLAEVEAQIEAHRQWGAPAAWTFPPRPAKPRPPGDLADLLLQRERLQEESYKAYRRVVAEGLR